MRKSYLFGLVFAAVFASFAVTAASAFATAKWLIDGNEVLELTPTDTEGALFLSDSGAGVQLKCEGILDGSVGANGEDEVTEVLNLAGELINKLGEAPELALECVSTSKSTNFLCAAGVKAKVYPDNLPWLTQLELMEPIAGENLYLDLLFTNGIEKLEQPGYESVCNGLEDLCAGNTSSDLENMLTEGDVLGIFVNEELELESLLGWCSIGGENTGKIEGEGLILFTGAATGLTLEVSE